MDNFEVIMDMANIGPRSHKFGVNLKMHILQPGNKKIQHGPRVKFFKKGLEFSGFSISLNEDSSKIKFISGSYKTLINTTELNSLIEKIQKYRIPLLNMWNDPDMTQDELLDQMELIDQGKEVKLVNPHKE